MDIKSEMLNVIFEACDDEEEVAYTARAFKKLYEKLDFDEQGQENTYSSEMKRMLDDALEIRRNTK